MISQSINSLEKHTWFRCAFQEKYNYISTTMADLHFEIWINTVCASRGK